MGFAVHTAVTVDERNVVATERLYLTADRSRVVAAGDPGAAVLFATPGKRIDRAEAVRLGLLEPEQVEESSDEGDVDEAAEPSPPEPEQDEGSSPTRRRRR